MYIYIYIHTHVCCVQYIYLVLADEVGMGQVKMQYGTDMTWNSSQQTEKTRVHEGSIVAS